MISLRAFVFEASLALGLAGPVVVVVWITHAVGPPAPPQLEPREDVDTQAGLRDLQLAREAIAAGAFVACTEHAARSLHRGRTKIALDGSWVRAQCALSARDFAQAKAALEEFKDNANITDPRYELAKRRLMALARGKEPAGVHE